MSCYEIDNINYNQVTHYQHFLKMFNEANETDCLIWPFGKTEYGYGIVNHGEKLHLTHRRSFEIFNKIKLNRKIIIRHSCDTPACFNPHHLLAGNHNDNVQDRVSRNRSAIGVCHGRAKLTEEQVIKIFQSDWPFQ